jgi:hypothetical protein
MGGLAFRIEAQICVPHLAWEPGAVALAADEVLGSIEVHDQKDRREAKAWLKELLADGPVAVKKIQQEAKAAGLSWITVRRAKDTLRVVANKSAYRGGWEWQLEDAHPTELHLNIFEQSTENTKLNSNGTAEDAHPGDVSTFPAFEDDGEVRL